MKLRSYGDSRIILHLCHTQAICNLHRSRQARRPVLYPKQVWLGLELTVGQGDICHPSHTYGAPWTCTCYLAGANLSSAVQPWGQGLGSGLPLPGPPHLGGCLLQPCSHRLGTQSMACLTPKGSLHSPGPTYATAWVGKILTCLMILLNYNECVCVCVCKGCWCRLIYAGFCFSSESAFQCMSSQKQAPFCSTSLFLGMCA